MYDEYAAGLYRYALMILTDHEMAENAVQEAFLKLIKLGKRARNIDRYAAYLRKAVRNECYRALERKHRQQQNQSAVQRAVLEVNETRQTDPSEHILIEEVLKTLPAEQREVLHLKVYEGKTFQEIAESLDISVNTAASRYRYAIDKLRKATGKTEART